MFALARLLLGVSFTLFFLPPSAFANCGDVDDGQVITASDALTVLSVAAGLQRPIVCPCDDCANATLTQARRHCADVNGDGMITARDALAIVLRAVGASVSLSCSCEACESPGTTTSTSTTTTTLCATDLDLDDRVFTRKKICCTPYSSSATPIITETITFNRLLGRSYEVLSAAGARLHDGILECTKFKVRATLGVWAGVWTFDGKDAFSGSSGSCNYTGAAAPAEPPNPTYLRCSPIMTKEDRH